MRSEEIQSEKDRLKVSVQKEERIDVFKDIILNFI